MVHYSSLPMHVPVAPPGQPEPPKASRRFPDVLMSEGPNRNHQGLQGLVESVWPVPRSLAKPASALWCMGTAKSDFVLYYTSWKTEADWSNRSTSRSAGEKCRGATGLEDTFGSLDTAVKTTLRMEGVRALASYSIGITGYT